MILICSARGARWIIEQPEGSTLPNHPRFQELLSIVKETCHNSQCQNVQNFKALLLRFV